MLTVAGTRGRASEAVVSTLLAAVVSGPFFFARARAYSSENHGILAAMFGAEWEAQR